MSYIFKTIILTAIFVAVIYFFMFKRRREKRKETFDSIKEFNKAYRNNDYPDHRNVLGQTNYITKYNSTEDYREKVDL